METIAMVIWTVPVILCLIMAVLTPKYRTNVTIKGVPRRKLAAFAVPGVIIITVALVMSTLEGETGRLGSDILIPCILSACILWFVLHELFVRRPICNNKVGRGS